jgi:threonine dehydrogenase-like Zn-dependent dehydrogenase
MLPWSRLRGDLRNALGDLPHAARRAQSSISFRRRRPAASSALISPGLPFKMAQTPVQRYLPQLLERIEKGEIDPSFVVTHRATREEGPEL